MSMAEAEAGVRVTETPRGILLEDSESRVFIPWPAVEYIVYGRDGRVEVVATRFHTVEVDYEAGVVKVFAEDVRVSAEVIRA